MREVLKLVSSKLGTIVITIIIAIAIIMLYVAAAMAEMFPIVLIFALVCAYFGWKSLNKITPSLFIWMPLIGWVIYFIIKFFLSVLIGYFVAPYQIGKKISSVALEMLEKEE